MNLFTKQIVFLFAIALLVLSCSNNKHKVKTTGTKNTEATTKKYENEYFSVSYPNDWICDVEEIDMTDSIPFMRKGIRATLCNSNPYAPWHLVMIQKSAMFDAMQTPEEWRDLSVQLKQFEDDYIGIAEAYMIDSISFGNYPAAMAGLVAFNEYGDTIIHKQLVVMIEKQVYYLNNSFPLRNSDEIQKKGDRILSSVRFSDKNK